MSLAVHPSATDERWLVIDASRPQEIALASVEPSADARLLQTTTYATADLPTFTDVLLRYERESGFRLMNTQCVLTVAGVAIGESIPIARTRLTISRSGLAVMFGKPVTIINDAVARAWAAVAKVGSTHNLRRIEAPNLTTPGRRVLITLIDGVGAATIDVDPNGIVHVQDSEVGHAGFAPGDEVEDRLLAAVRRGGTLTSWERILLLDVGGPEWALAMPGSNRPDRVLRHARLVGSFTSDVTLMFGAWQGALLTGVKVPFGTATNAEFDVGFVSKRPFRRLLQDTPCWKVEQQDYVLRGGAALLARRYAEQIGVKAREAAVARSIAVAHL